MDHQQFSNVQLKRLKYESYPTPPCRDPNSGTLYSFVVDLLINALAPDLVTSADCEKLVGDLHSV